MSDEELNTHDESINECEDSIVNKDKEILKHIQHRYDEEERRFQFESNII